MDLLVDRRSTPSSSEAPAGLVGRDGERALLRAFLAEACHNGAALLLSGEAGIGKTALAETAGRDAVPGGGCVLRAAGVESETGMAFSGLHQALLPLHNRLGLLSRPQRDALSVALGLADGPVPDALLVSTATLTLLRRVAADRPVLVVVDDLQWLDRASATVLGFVARRLTPGRIGVLATTRPGAGSVVEHAGLPRREVGPLSPEAAFRLLRDRFPGLAPRVAQRVLREARGNPLALLELPAELTRWGWAARLDLPPCLPLTARLHRLFAAQVEALPIPTRQLLLLMALDGTADVGVALRAAPPGVGLADLGPAERAGLVGTDMTGHEIVFRHPLVRSTVVGLSTTGERTRAHTALAEALTDQPERRARHLADAALGPDDKVADLLEQSASWALRRGDPVGAVGTLLRAARLTGDGAARARRLAHAAYLGADVTGELRTAFDLLVEAHRAHPDPRRSLAASTAAAYAMLNGRGDVATAHGILAAAVLHDTSPGPDDHALVEALHTLMLICFFSGRHADWGAFHTGISRLGSRVPDSLALCAATFADPVTASPPTLRQLDAAVADLSDETDPSRIVRIAIAAFFVDRLAGCRGPLWRVVRHGRAGGAVASAVNGLMLLAFDALQAGRWAEADSLAHEGLDLCEAHGYRLLAWPGWYARALLAAQRGDDDTAEALKREMLDWADPRGVEVVQMYAWHAAALASLGRGDPEAAYRYATAISPPGTLARHVGHALWVIMDVVEAAVQTGRHDQAAAHVAAVEAAGVAALSPRLALLAAGAAAIAAPDRTAPAAFERALSLPGIDQWPFDVSRVRLAYGERLRRSRAVTAARRQLTAALETFDRLGARPWAVRARAELRAGARTAAPDVAPLTPLTAQEREIAELAASGLSNKEIARRLHLSHRTVGGHLYRLFPKLGITSRAALRDALAVVPGQRSDPA